MKRVHIIGRKNHGKTTLVVELVQTLSKNGFRVGTIKHTHHEHELDAPGKDSHCHREAGADVVGICSPSMNAVFWPPKNERPSADETKYAPYQPMFEHCDIVLVEGDSQTNAPKIEVWRSKVGTNPLAETDASIKAVISNDNPPHRLDVPLWGRSDIEAIMANVLKL